MDIDVSLVRELVAQQFPHWVDLPIQPVESGGYDNRTFHLGSELLVRLPSHERYAAQVEKEQKWLPRLAPLLPLPIPAPVALGAPATGYPWHWSVYRWIEGESAAVGRIEDLPGFATELAGFLHALQQADPTDGPLAGMHNFFRGAPLTHYDTETRDAIAVLRSEIDGNAVTGVWEAALDANWHGTPVWLHGDVSASNLLVSDGRLCAVIDFGCAGVGDPACDLVIAWTFFSGAGREAFLAGLPLDGDAWARGRGWALWKGLITLAKHVGAHRSGTHEARRVIDDVVSDHEARG